MDGSADNALKDAIELYGSGRRAEAEQAYRAIVAAYPNYVPGHRRLIGLLRTDRRWPEALAAARAGARANPDDAALRYTLAVSLLELGHWDEGFIHYEARRAIAPHEFLAAPAGYPEWRGEPLKSLAILPEQGFGDAIQFARYAQVLAAAGVQVTLLCRPELLRLFGALGVSLQSADNLAGLRPHDFWAYQASLPRWLRGAPPARFGIPLRSGGGVGVIARGNPAHRNDPQRSLRGADAVRLGALGMSLHPEDTKAADFYETAEIVAGLDLVISVDTAVAHLAASLGKPCWVLLPAIGSDWRWMHDRSDSPWYPTVRLYRQSRAGDWDEALTAIERDLEGFLAGRAAG